MKRSRYGFMISLLALWSMEMLAGGGWLAWLPLKYCAVRETARAETLGPDKIKAWVDWIERDECWFDAYMPIQSFNHEPKQESQRCIVAFLREQAFVDGPYDTRRANRISLILAGILGLCSKEDVCFQVRKDIVDLLWDMSNYFYFSPIRQTRILRQILREDREMDVYQKAGVKLKQLMLSHLSELSEIMKWIDSNLWEWAWEEVLASELQIHTKVGLLVERIHDGSWNDERPRLALESLMEINCWDEASLRALLDGLNAFFKSLGSESSCVKMKTLSSLYPILMQWLQSSIHSQVLILDKPALVEEFNEMLAAWPCSWV